MNKEEILKELDGLLYDVDNGNSKVASYGRRLGDKFYTSIAAMKDVDNLTAANILLYIADELALGAMLTGEEGLLMAATGCYSVLGKLLEDIDD